MITSVTPALGPNAIVIAAPYAPAGQVISGTSTTPLAIPLAPPYPAYTWAIVETNIGFRLGMRVRAAAMDATAGVTTWIEGVVTAWDETNLTVQIDLVSGLGLHTAWNVNVTGQPGLTGPKGDPGATGAQGPAYGTSGTGTSIADIVLSGQPTSTFTPGQGTTHANDATLATTQFVTTAVSFSLNNTQLLGTPTAPTPAAGDNDTSIATTAFVATSFAPINNPVLSGDPKAPTPIAGDNDTSIATTAFVVRAFAPLDTPTFIGDPKAPTAALGDNDVSIATTAFVARAILPLAPLNGPAFGGEPTAITPALGDSSTSLATTAFVGTAIQPLAPINNPHFTGPTVQAPTPPQTSFDSTVATTAFVKTAIVPLATLDTPTFTGLPKAPTQQQTVNDSTIATTAYVHAGLSGYQPLNPDLSAIAGLTGAGVIYYRSSAGVWAPVSIGANITFAGGVLAAAGGGGGSGTIAEAPADGTYWARRNDTWAAEPIQADAPSDSVNYIRINGNWANISTALASYAPLAGPVFTGDAKAVTPSIGDNDTSIATTAFVVTALLNYAPLTTPAFSGTPTAPTPAAISNDGTIATTQFVKTAISTLAPLAAPVFTGDARAVTPTAGDNDTSIATTAFVVTAIAGKADTTAVAATYAPLAAPVFTGDARLAVTPTAGDNDTSIATTAFVTAADIVATAPLAPLASPTLTTPRVATTPTAGDNSTLIASTAFVANATASGLKSNVTATITVGYTFTPNNLGTITSGTVTPAAANGNYQYYTNNGAHTIAAPTADCAIDILVTNGTTAGAITFTGFTVAATNFGDPLTLTNTSKFIISMRRINGIATYMLKALQ